MNSIRRYATLILAVSLSAVSLLTQRSFSQTTSNSHPSTESEVLDVLHRQAEAGIHRDVAVLEEILDPDYFHTNPDGSLMTRADAIESYRKPTQFSFSSEELDDLKTVIASDSVIVNARVTLKGKRVDDAFTSRYRVTYVLRRTHSGWKVLNSHSSLLSIMPRN